MLEMIPNWCAKFSDSWARIVDWWCDDQWAQTHNACRERRLLMPGIPHHQGSRSLSGYASSWSATHGGEACSTFKAYALSQKKKATSDVQYNPDDPAEAYSNPFAYAHLQEYTSMARSIHGSEYDPSAHDVDGEIAMRALGGRRHGRLGVGDGAVDPTSTPLLSAIRARSTGSTPDIRPRPTALTHVVSALQPQSAGSNNPSQPSAGDHGLPSPQSQWPQWP